MSGGVDRGSVQRKESDERIEKGKGEDGVGNGHRRKTQRGEPEQNKKREKKRESERRGGRKSILK